MYNETNINICLEKLPNADEIIVVDGNKTSTLDLIESLHVKKFSSQKGRANQMNEGAKYAFCEVLLFLHADTILPKNALLHVKEVLEQKDVVAGAFDLTFDTQKRGLKFIAKVASWRSRKTRLPYGDQAIFIKKEVFERVGGYEDIALMEDVNLMQKLKEQKLKIKIINQKVTTSPRRYEKNGILLNLLKNWVLVSLYFFGVNPNKLAKLYK